MKINWPTINLKIGLRVLIGLIIFLILLFLVNFFISLNRKASKEIFFTVKQGQGTREISKSLKQEGLIASPFYFNCYIYLNGWTLKNGVYKIGPQMKTKEVAEMISEGKVAANQITIIEGWRVSEIDEYLAGKKIIVKGELLKIASVDEGYLFPDTYQLPLTVNASDIRQIMVENYKTKIKGLNVTDDNLILASIVEREANRDIDRAKIAGVYLNRLKIGMKLDADPTIQYAKGSWKPITRNDYANFKSPYNTYLNKGLPPTPICNPGLKSIEAVINPEKHDYLFFFTAKDGKTIFSKTLEEHNLNLQLYQ